MFDKTAARFSDRFKSFAPEIASEKTYAARSAKSLRAKFDDLAADGQKFRNFLGFIRSRNPRAVTKDETISMAIAKFPHSMWRYHSAYKAFKSHLKISYDFSVSGALANS